MSPYGYWSVATNPCSHHLRFAVSVSKVLSLFPQWKGTRWETVSHVACFSAGLLYDAPYGNWSAATNPCLLHLRFAVSVRRVLSL